MWHIAIDNVSLLIMLTLLFKAFRTMDRSNTEERAFTLILLVSIFSVLVDIVSALAMNRNDNWMVFQVSMILYCIICPLPAAGWMCYSIVYIFRNGPESPKYISRLAVPFDINAALAISNPWTGLYFHLSRDMQYSRGILFLPALYGLILFYTLSGIIIIVVNRKRIDTSFHAALLIICFIIPLIIMWLQSYHPYWLITSAAYVIVYMLCDMTIEEDRRRLLTETIIKQNRALTEAVARAKHADEAKTVFLSHMSHDIRTPMNGIIGMTRIARQEDNPPKTADCLEKIRYSSEYLLGLINNILDIEKIESGMITLHPEPYPAEEFQHYFDSVIRPLCDAKRLTLRQTGRPDPDHVPVMDKLRINQVLFNLISNAVKYTPEGGTIEYRLEEKTEGEKIRFSVAVIDSGKGMSPEFQKIMFEPYTQEDRVRNTDSMAGSSGLGLTIVKQIMDLMGGSIEVESAVNKGTSVTLRCLVDSVDAEDYRKRVQDRRREDFGAVLSGRRVLLCEDNEINREVAKAVLEQAGMQVDIAENGFAGRQHFMDSAVGSIDFILMDIRMPIMDGYEATASIRSLDRPDAALVPIIAMTADAFEDDVRKCMNAGMNAHIAKPFEPEDIYRILAEQIRP